ncbi:MAG TPA: hypothetical protein VIW94_11105 [Acidimicrobiia bacterium]
MVFDPPRQKRRLLRWLLPVALVVAALVGLAAQGAGSDAREEIDYLNELSAQTTDLAIDGDALRDVVSRLSRIERPELETVIENLEEDIVRGLQFVEQEPPSDDLLAVRALYRVALEQWDVGVAGFGEGILAAADEPESTTPTDTIANSIVALRSGDELFVQVRSEIDRSDVPDPINPLRVVVLSPASGEAIALSLAYTEAARSPTNGIALRPGLAASMIVADPEWQLNPENQVVMPATESVVFSVVVTNVGNLISEEEPITLTLVGPGDPVELSSTIPPLEPGAQTTIIFEALPVTPDELYEVTAEVKVVGVDIDFEDNFLEVMFRVNSE